MKKFLLFLMFALFCVPWAANAQETLTVCDGTATSSNAPIKSGGGSQTEFIYPASLLESMEGGTITSVKFFSSSTSTTNYSNTVTVFVEEVASSTISASAWQYNQSTATKVYEGTTLTVSNGELVINFNTPFEYNGGNLCFNIWSASNTPAVSYYYLATTNSCGYDYYITPPVSNPYSTGSNLPKAEFTYTAASGTCEKPATLEYSNLTSSSVDLSWTGGSGVYNIELNDNIIEQSYQGSTYNLTNLEAATSYTVKVQSVCGEETSGWKNVSFTTPCASYDIPYTYGFEDAAPFACWTVISGTVSRQSGTTNTGSYRLDFRGTTSNMIALPQFNEATNNLRVEFWTRPENTGGNSGKFAIGYMTDITDASTFVAVDTYNSTEMTTSYVKKTVDFMNVPADANIAMRQFDCSTNYYWYVDDVTVKEIPSCLAPTALAATATTNSAELSWTANSGESAWTVYYKKASDENYTEVTNATNPYTLNGLDASSNYQYYVVANCSADDASEPSEVFTFATACDVIAALGYSENFDSYTAGNNVLPTCWNYINTTTYSSYQVYPRVYANSSYSTYANTAPNCLYLYSYYSSWTDYDPQPQYAILPEMDGLNGMQVTLMARGYNATSTFKIGTMSDPTDVGTFQLIAEQALTTSHDEYSFIVNQEGNYLAIMIDAANESRTSNGAYIDDISIDNAPTCLKPSSPMLETPASRTAHTATLKWTNGEEGQSAWQIAYSTSATFAPAADFTPGENEWLVEADANPYTLNGLQANTTYYAYVRANCGNGDLSAWSRTKATFTTTIANAAPTGLAVDASSITSESATVTWTGVATNDYHDSYELYFSTETTMPEELVAENLITGITAESYELTHLEAETPYYVWVRDNCGNDGLSAWSSRASFTTASSCQTPDGLAESNVTNESATITWNTYGLNEFNLRYGTDGENWNTIERVNTPYTLDRLTASTTYQVQVQATCANAETWSNVLSFTTACDAIADLPWNENFDAYTGSTSSTVPTGYPNDELPMCWQFLNRSDNSSTYPQVFISSNSGYPVSGKCLFFKSSSSTPLYAVLPEFREDISALQLTFTYRNEGTSTSNGTLIVGYMTDPADATTFTTVLTCEQTTTLTEKDVLFTNAPSGSYIAFMYQGGSSSNFYMSIDNVSVDYIPTCQKPTELAVTTNALNATITWVSEVGTYDVAYATDATANPDENIAGTATEETYTMNGLALGDHYIWVRANCGSNGYSEWIGPVSAHIGYCVPNPSSRDGKGITSVVFGTGDNVVSNVDETNGLPSAAPYYGDYSSMVGAMHAGVESTVSITYATGSSTVYSYGTIIWVDWDNSLSFEDNEIVYTGTSNQGSGGAPQVLEASFTVPADQATGEYRMRIAGADSYFDSYIGGTATGNHSACFSSSYAVCHDYTLRVLEAPSCMMPTNVAVNYTGGTTATVTWEGTAETYNIDVNGTVINDVATPYTIEGLELATTYAVMVQANCENDETSEWSNAVSFTTDLCMPENQCEITFELTDSYGDGWNGGAGIRVIDVETNAEIGFMTNEDLDGESYDVSELNTLTLAVCDGREIQFVWVSGDYDDECSYVVKDANGEVIFSGQYTDLLDEPVNYVVNCAAPGCGKILVDAQNPEWSEDFEDDAAGITTPYTGILPACWSVPVEYTSAEGDVTPPQVYYKPDFNATENGSY
ncbi:MAG: fibronectin type III domain-containing protein, partial [Bacteroidales bacterium]|nr:fibronectin type III domain-containing protein [Bacteroidales bacterium]